MLKRLVSMAIGIALLFFIMIFNNSLIFCIAVTVVSIIGLYEFYSAMRKINIRPIEFIGYIASLLLIAIPYISANLLRLCLSMALPFLVFILFSIVVLTNNKKNIVDISATLFGIVYVTFLLSFIIFTRQMEKGIYYTWFILGGAWMTDTFAYIVGVLLGKTIGNHKFSSISPNKSIEGCVGGIAGCVLFFILYTKYLGTIGIELNYYIMAIIGIVTSVISQIGDLAASAIKRHCKIKDFGSIMPGHGGVLDRFDSILLVAPFLYLFFNLI